MKTKDKINRNSKREIERDIEFLKEIKEKFQSAKEKRDPTLYDYGYKLIGDWIDELSELL